MPSDRHVINGVEHVLLHDPSRPAEQILVSVSEAAVEKDDPEGESDA